MPYGCHLLSPRPAKMCSVSDRRLRDLERRGTAGDSDAQAAFHVELIRAGRAAEIGVRWVTSLGRVDRLYVAARPH